MALAALLLLGAAGTAPRSWAGVTPEEERAAGRRVAAQVETYFGLLEDPARLARVVGVGKRIEKAAGIPAGTITWRLIDSPDFNALSIPGDRIYVARGLVDAVGTDAELAAALAHEVAHIILGHTRQLLEERTGRRRITLVLESPAGDGPMERRVTVLEGPRAAVAAREKELSADRKALGLLRKAGYRPAAALAMLAHLAGPGNRPVDGQETLGSEAQGVLSSHPSAGERIRLVQDSLRQSNGQ